MVGAAGRGGPYRTTGEREVFFLAVSMCGPQNKWGVEIPTVIVFVFLPFWGELGVIILGFGSLLITAHVDFFFFPVKIRWTGISFWIPALWQILNHCLHMGFSPNLCAHPTRAHCLYPCFLHGGTEAQRVGDGGKRSRASDTRVVFVMPSCWIGANCKTQWRLCCSQARPRGLLWSPVLSSLSCDWGRGGESASKW